MAIVDIVVPVVVVFVVIRHRCFLVLGVVVVVLTDFIFAVCHR